MGNISDVSSIVDYEDENDKPIVGFGKTQIDTIKEEYVTFANADGTVNLEKLIDKASLQEDEAKRILDFLDMDKDQKVTFYEFLCSFSVLNAAKMETKAEIFWNFYHISSGELITEQELIIFARTCLTQINIMNGDDAPEDSHCERQAKDWLYDYDKVKLEGQTVKKNMLNKEEWKRMFLNDMTVIKMIYQYGLISRCGGGEQIPEWDPDLDEETRKADADKDERLERIKNGIEMKLSSENEKLDMTPDELKKILELEQTEQVASFNWMTKANLLKPKAFTGKDHIPTPPAANLSIDHVYGFRCHDTRNNLKISLNGDIIYTCAAIVVLYNSESHKQRYYMQHNDDVTAIDICYDRNLVATGQLGSKPFIWVVNAMNILAYTYKFHVLILMPYMRLGPRHIGNQSYHIREDGDKIAAVGLDDLHSIAVYDYDKVIKARAGGFANVKLGLIAKGTNTRLPCWDLMFSQDSKTIICASKNEVGFFTYFGGMLMKTKGIWDIKTSPMSALCNGRLGDKIITGMFKGTLIVWENSRQVYIQKAHGAQVTAMCTRSITDGIVTGGNDGEVKVWDWVDGKLKEVEDYHLQELDKQLNLQDFKISAVFESKNGRLIVGTRGSEIIELKPKLRVLVKGHCVGELNGLCVNPKKNIFYTCGQDKIVASWDMDKRETLANFKVEKPSNHIEISPDGVILAVGSSYGEIYFFLAKEFENKSEEPKIQEIIDEKFDNRDEPVTCMKFTPDSKNVAVCFENNMILIYDIKSFKSISKFKISNNPVHIDFSKNGQYMLINTLTEEDDNDPDSTGKQRMMDIQFYEVKSGKNMEAEIDLFKQQEFFTQNCISAYFTQGIWPACSLGTDVNSCDLALKSKVLATGDDFSKVKLFKYPCHMPGSGYVKFSGHAANVTKVRFSQDEKYLISIGGEEKSIIQWKFEYDTQGDTENSQAQKVVIPKQDLGELISEEDVIQGDQAVVAKEGAYPPLGNIKDPSWYKRDDKKFNKLPNGELTLYHAFGFRAHYIDGVDDCRRMGSYLSDGKISYVVAGVGVTMDIQTYEQTFFQGHDEDIVSFAKHPVRDLVATGQMAASGKAKIIDIFIWDANSKRIISQLNDFHLRAIVYMEFSPSGTQLLTAGQDNDNSIAIYDWMGKRLITTQKVDKNKLNGIAWKSEIEFMTVGAKHVKFWTLNGRNLSNQSGRFGVGKFQPQLCCAYLADGRGLSGGIDGNIYIWSGNEVKQVVPAHKGKVAQLLVMNDGQILSGGQDGKVLIWDKILGKSNQLADITTISSFKLKAEVTTLSVLGDNLLIGSKTAELYTMNIKSKSAPKNIMQGHFQGELWGATNSFQTDQICTSGGDKTIRVWDINKKQMIIGTDFYTIDIRAVDWAANGKFIAAGDVKGNIYTIDPSTLKQISMKPSFFFDAKATVKQQKWIEDIKVSKDSNYIALGAHNCGSVIDIRDFNINFQLKPGFSSALTHLDWSSDGKYIIANSQAKELRFYDVTAKKDIPPTSIIDTNWFSFTCTFGWAVQGIFQTADFSEVNTSGRTYNQNFNPQPTESQFGKYAVATGDDNGDINLYNWPVCVKKQVHHTYQGHASHVVRVRFTPNDKYLISVGGNDKTVFVWKTAFSFDQDEEDDDIGGIKLKKKKKKVVKEKKPMDPEQIFEEEDLEKGDEFAACLPWLGAIKAPSDYTPGKDLGKKPNKKPKLEYVFGVREKDVRNNVRYTSTGKIVYHMAGLGIVLEPVKNTQTFFELHTDDIIAIDISKDGTLAVTGEIGPKPLIYLWNIESKEVQVKWNGPLLKGITCIAFSPDASKVAAVSLNEGDKFPYAVFDVKSKGCIFSDKSGPTQILELSWLDETSFAGVGNKSLIEFTVGSGNPPVSKKGLQFGKFTNKVCTVTAYNKLYVAGAADGQVLVFEGGTATKCLKEHTGVVECVSGSNEFLLTGCQGGTVNIWDKTLSKPLITINTKSAKVDGPIICQLANKYAKSIRSLTLSKDNSKLLLATYGSEIHELKNSGGNTITAGGSFTEDNVLMTGHYTPCQKWTNEIWGIDNIKKDIDKFCSCGDDGTLRIYSIKERKQIAIVETTLNAKKKPENPDKKTGDPADSTKGRCVGVNKAGNTFIVGMKDGTMKAYKYAKNALTQFKHFKTAKEWISDIAFSADDKKLAFGSHDNKIYLFGVGKKWKPLGKGPLNKHSSYITHFDFSEDGMAIHSTCGAYELLFWDLKNFKQNPSGATAYRDEQWLTWTCPLGWPVQGIWPECSKGTDINAVARSSDKKYLATADDFSTLKIFAYPCLNKGAEFTEGKGHSSHVTNCKWSYDDKYIFTSGGEDQAIILWKIV